MNPLGGVYTAIARRRRHWYEQSPERRRHLPVPVISVGNLAVGGSGKTPAAAAIAAMLRDVGERPAILSRGYGRRVASRAPVVVGDGARVRVPARISGDEPQLLARSLPGVPVIVGSDRHAAGEAAIRQFDATVLLLDDGFQHLRLARDVDLLVVTARDVDDRVLPAGRLREPLDAARGADALLVVGDAAVARGVCARLGVRTAFTVRTVHGAACAVASAGTPLSRAGVRVDPSAGLRILALAGIARPERFFAALDAQGWNVVRRITMRDHHWFSARDMARIARAARGSLADLVLTTEKDAVRLDVPLGAEQPHWGYVPMRVHIDPEDAFRQWLVERLIRARAA